MSLLHVRVGNSFVVFLILAGCSVSSGTPPSPQLDAQARWQAAKAAVQRLRVTSFCRTSGRCTPSPSPSAPLSVEIAAGVNDTPAAAVPQNSSASKLLNPSPPLRAPPLNGAPLPALQPSVPRPFSPVPPGSPVPQRPAPPPPAGPAILNLTLVLRLEIKQLAQDPLLVDLLLLSLAAIQAKPSSDPYSFYALAGIHGEPYVAYRGVVPSSKRWSVSQAAKRWGGYCTHSSNVFPTWHRPYLALFEQALMAEALVIAQSYPDTKREAYVAAAQRFRLPYWDWADDDSVHSGMPAILRDPVRTVHHPSKGTISIPNPLAGYTLVADVDGPASDKKFPLRMRRGQATARWPSPSDKTPKTHNAQLIPQVKAATKQWQQQILNVLLNPDWKCFASNAAWVANGNRATAQCPLISLEGLHDQIHAVGGGTQGKAPKNIFGTMALLEVAAFDPLFWLHHVNVDRILALWQALHPKLYVSTGPDRMGSYYDSPGGSVSVRTPLTPFRPGAPWTAAQAAAATAAQAQGQSPPTGSTKFYTSLEVVSPATFGYSYAELQGNPAASKLWGQLHAKYHGKSGLRWHLSVDAIPMEQVRPGFAIDVFVKPHPSRRRASELSAANASASRKLQGGPVDDTLLAGSMRFFMSGSSSSSSAAWNFSSDASNGPGVRSTVDLTAALEAQGYDIEGQPASGMDGDLTPPAHATFTVDDLRLVAADPRDADLVSALTRSAVYIAYHQCDAPSVAATKRRSTRGGADGDVVMPFLIGAFAADGRTLITHRSLSINGDPL